MEVTTVYELEGMDFLSLSILCIWLGVELTQRVALLRDNFIPPAVTGGFLFSLAVAGIYAVWNVDVVFDMRIRDLLLLTFFSSIGLKARLRRLLAGGKPLITLIVASALFLLLQDTVGVMLALILGAKPGYGLMAGSVSFAGGHGTAIAWGAEAEAAGLAEAQIVGIAFATFGLIAGGVLGGPVARYLITRDKLEPQDDSALDAPPPGAGKVPREDDRTFHTLRTFFVMALCVSFGDVVNRFLFERDVLVPGFLTAMFVGILITNTYDTIHRPLKRETLDRFGEISLGIFLVMSMMSMDLVPLLSMGWKIVIVFAVQAALMLFFALFVIYRSMGRDFDAAVIASGFTGLGLGATPVAIANMDAVTQRFGPSAKAFLVVPLVGAFFIDILNAAVIKFFLEIISGWLG